MTIPEFEIHECEHLPKSGVQVICAWDFALREHSTWMLVIQRDATAADLEENSYLESGNQFTLDYGDINESFYSSLESMLDRILSALKNQPEDMNKQYMPRLSIQLTVAA